MPVHTWRRLSGMEDGVNDCIIYSIRQISTGRRYIGKTEQLKNRWNSHRHAGKRGLRHPLYDAIRESGLGDFRFSVIEATDWLTARSREREITTANNAWYPEGFSLPHAGPGVPSRYPAARKQLRQRRAARASSESPS